MRQVNYHGDEDYKKYEGLFENIFQKRVDLILPHFAKAPRGRLLEIGSATGVMLKLFAKRGWDALGIEPSGSSQEAKKKGLKVLNVKFEEAKLPKDYFNLIILNHTLEHMDNPKLILKKINTLLKDRGIVFIDVPNFGSLSSKLLGKKWPYLLPLEHKSQFTKESLTKLLKDNGFKVLYWESRSGIFEYANPLKELGRKRFLLDLFAIPYSLSATILGMGDSMSFVARKI
jgi:2-polyprenyl-3-methyl-5-hydroxy-6-metoxy-1,4-benzoquinol methylase